MKQARMTNITLSLSLDDKWMRAITTGNDKSAWHDILQLQVGFAGWEVKCAFPITNQMDWLYLCVAA